MTTEPLSQTVWLLRNKLNPFPVMATLSLDAGRLQLELPPLNTEMFHGWVAERIGRPHEELTTELQAGRAVQVLNTTEFTLTWPKSFAGAAMQIDAAGSEWLACLAYFSGGGLLQTMNLFTARGRAKTWKAALAELG